MSALPVTSDTPMHVVLQFRKEEALYVRERIWHPTQRLKELPDGGLRLSFRAGGVVEILRWGSGVTVLQPRRLRQLVTDKLQAVNNLYH
jgi:predicted DNA-binding transcriptional regulator YafY